MSLLMFRLARKAEDMGGGEGAIAQTITAEEVEN